MKKYKIVEQSVSYTIYKKRWLGWKHLFVWFKTSEEAEAYIRNLNSLKGLYPVIKKLEFI